MRLYDIVKQILAENSQTRSSDKLLIWKVWEYQNAVFNDRIDFTSFIKATTPESITRARRKIQEIHEDLRGSQYVQEKRKQKEKLKGSHVYSETLFQLDRYNKRAD